VPVMRVERRLAAIMATDIVGYSRLVEADEARTLAAIRSLRATTLSPLIADCKGRIVKLIGDGMIVEFGSVVDAVACSIAVQEAVTADQRDVPPESRIVLRIGINVGDVVVEGDDLLGDGVNIAARLEALAAPGGICIADAVQKQLAGKTDFAFEDIGEQTLKNIVQPVRVWRWSKAPTPAASGVPLPLPDRPSIAVLPFDNLSGQPEETYFSDGITEDIITGLARFRSLFVVARNSSFAFRGKPTSLAEIGRQLGVAYLLEGSIRRAGERVRVTAQLLEAATGMHIWADRYDRGLEDIFAVQEEVARTIVSTLVGRIHDARLQKSLRRPPASLAAYDCLLRGLAHYRGFGEDDNRKAYEMFERAVTLDPQYALAHAYLAAVTLALRGSAAAPPEALDAAFAAMSHALELDPQESYCQNILGLIWLYRRDYDAAEHHYRRALDLNPNDADRRMAFGYILALRGKAEDGLGWMQEAMRLNPFHPTWYSARLGIVLYSLRRYAEAAQALRRIPTPGYWSRTRLAACYGQLGRSAEAEAQKAAILQEKPHFTIAEFFRRDVLLERAEDRELLHEGLVKAGLPE
jgi:adenylate cyclase